ncbi:hypothetical protein F2Q70_00010308 [Brassica cretica]|uniref:Uncharacterized protein n=2 Tax=Brassica cretica TaxID=69181 RepID=A0A8S9M0G6_BRACR|nr:hypothetical protein F2Q70_00010308 [Brassica cretica]KAF3510669.1 hypothetical protein F2Q69_00004092 [Brassica cretica]KAF3549760.1 hypothetical protein DY000_02004805 [Brassica cretica]
MARSLEGQEIHLQVLGSCPRKIHKNRPYGSDHQSFARSSLIFTNTRRVSQYLRDFNYRSLRWIISM